MESNTTSSTELPFKYDDSIAILLFSITMVTSTFGFLGNCFVIHVIRKKSELRTNAFLFLGHQAASDGLYSLLNFLELIICLDCWSTNSTMSTLCGLAQGTQLSCFHMSAYFIFIIGLERIIKIYSSKNLPYPMSIALAIWILVYPYGLQRFSSISHTTFFSDQGVYGCGKADLLGVIPPFVGIITLIVYNLIPFLFTGLFYILILVKLRRRKYIGNVDDKRRETFMKAMSNTTKLCIAITIGFYATQLPAKVLGILTMGKHNGLCRTNGTTDVNFAIVFFLVDISQCINPIILCYFNHIFRNEAKGIFRSLFQSRPTRNEDLEMTDRTGEAPSNETTDTSVIRSKDVINE